MVTSSRRDSFMQGNHEGCPYGEQYSRTLYSFMPIHHYLKLSFLSANYLGITSYFTNRRFGLFFSDVRIDSSFLLGGTDEIVKPNVR